MPERIGSGLHQVPYAVFTLTTLRAVRWVPRNRPSTPLQIITLVRVNFICINKVLTLDKSSVKHYVGLIGTSTIIENN